MEAFTQKHVFQEVLLHFHAAIAHDITELLIRYREPVLNDTMLPPQVMTTVGVLRARYEVLSEQQLVLLLAREWERLQIRYEQGMRGEELFRRDPPPWREIKKVACPFCGFAHLSIVAGTGGKQVECAQCDDGVFDRDLLDV